MTRVDLGYEPHRFQLEIHQNLKRFSVLVCHRRFGKTFLSINTLIIAALRTKKPAARFGYVAPFRSQAKSIAWDYLKHFGCKVPGVTVNESELYVEFPNGSRIRLFGADNPDSMRGLYFDGIVLDEVADMKPEVWGEILRPALSDRKGWALFIGTPKGINMFSELYHHALKDDAWYAAIFRVSQTKLIDDQELAMMKATMTESQIAQELECDFSASSDNVLITVAEARQSADLQLGKDAFSFAPKIIGVDVARYGGDRSVIFKRQGLQAWPPLVMRDVNNMDLAARVAKEIDDYKPDAVFVDAGRGEGVIDRLRQLGYRVTEVNFGGKAINDMMVNKRTEMWLGMAEWIKQGGSIPDHQELISDICTPTYTHANASGKMMLEPKDKIKERGLPSPDVGDALALTFAMPVRVGSRNFSLSPSVVV